MAAVSGVRFQVSPTGRLDTADELLEDIAELELETIELLLETTEELLEAKEELELEASDELLLTVDALLELPIIP